MTRALATTTLGLALAVVPHVSWAQPSAEVAAPELPWLDNDYYKVHVSVRPRMEVARVDAFGSSQAYTIQSHLGLEMKPWEGFSTYLELENVWSLDDDAYNSGVEGPSSDTLIADPETTELNQVWLQFERDDLLRKLAGGAPNVKLGAKAGRQVVIFDDARFIGNVGWRQNEQTFDVALGETDLSIPGLTAQYAYLWHARRVFGDRGGSPATRDWKSDSHLVRLQYTGFESVDVSTFAYLLDFRRDAPAGSSNSYGLRITGKHAFDEVFTLRYAGSYAYQTDAARNPTDYQAHYIWAGVDLERAGLGVVGVAYEMLGSDDGKAVFVTPLATAHGFNGFADAFVTNGGAKGLHDLRLEVSPKLPWKMKGSLLVHEFWQADGGTHIGTELDGTLSRPINEYLKGLLKFAWFEGQKRGPADRWRLWLQLTFDY